MTEPFLLDQSTAVGRIARFYPATINVFEAMDVEFASKGARPLRDAATATGLAPDDLLSAVKQVVGGASPAAEGTIAELIESLVGDHRRLDDPAMREIMQHLQEANGAPELARVRRILSAIRATMGSHTVREERDLFMRIEVIDLHPHHVRAGSLSRPLLVEFVEHDTIHHWLLKVRELVLRLRVRGADPGLLDSIDAWDRALHRHLHAENNVLIPRVLDLEHRLKARLSAGREEQEITV